jgi:titin
LKWKEPESNGGLPIKLYFLERKEKKFGPWVKERKIKVPSTEFTVEGLREGVDYYFRLLAENDEGSSKPVETSQVIQLTKAPSKYIVY